MPNVRLTKWLSVLFALVTALAVIAAPLASAARAPTCCTARTLGTPPCASAPCDGESPGVDMCPCCAPSSPAPATPHASLTIVDVPFAALAVAPTLASARERATEMASRTRSRPPPILEDRPFALSVMRT